MISFLAATRMTSISSSFSSLAPRIWKSMFTSLASKGMYRSASHWMDSANSSSVITGRLIFLTITEWPETEVTTSFVLILKLLIRSRIVSTITTESIRDPSTMASGGMVAMAELINRCPLLVSVSSTTLMELEPISKPITSFFFPSTMFSPLLKQSRIFSVFLSAWTLKFQASSPLSICFH